METYWANAGEGLFYPTLGSQSIQATCHNSLVMSYRGDENEYEDHEIYGEAVRDSNISRYLHLLAFCPTTAYEKSLQDVYSDQQKAQEDHGQLTLANSMQTARDCHLQTFSSIPDSREILPFRQGSPYICQSRQPQEISIGTEKPILDKHDFNGQKRAIPFQNQLQISGLYSLLPNTVPSQQIAQIPDVVSQQGPAESHHGLTMQTPIFTSDMISTEATSEKRSSVPSIPQACLYYQTQLHLTPQDRRLKDSSGTYSYPGHGCIIPSDQPVKQKKHKRERYRRTLHEPYRCDKTILFTGKPCNSTFSRRHDLSRHNSTVHNALVEKARCHLCPNEKTFVRKDALSRHKRALHPGRL